VNKLVSGCFILIIFSYTLFSQEKTQKIYAVEENAMAQLDNAVAIAGKNEMHVLVMVGGDWCKWCVRLDKFLKETQKVDSLIKADFVLVHINYSKENKNPEAMARLEYPQRFGFPVFVILNENGKRIHTQNTGYLEDGEGYSEDKILDFLKSWNRKAINPINYLN
jgi:thioredoxin-related protein